MNYYKKTENCVIVKTITDHKKGGNHILGKLVVCLVGMILIVFGGRQILKRRDFMKKCEEITGEIFDYQKYMSDHWSYVYTFTLPTGQKIVGTDHVYHHDKQRRRKGIGEKIQLLYNRENPREFKRKSEWDMVIGFYLMVLMGIVYLVLGIFVIS